MQFRFEDATPQTRGSGPGPEAVSEPGVRQAPMLDAGAWTTARRVANM